MLWFIGIIIYNDGEKDVNLNTSNVMVHPLLMPKFVSPSLYLNTSNVMVHLNIFNSYMRYLNDLNTSNVMVHQFCFDWCSKFVVKFKYI